MTHTNEKQCCDKCKGFAEKGISILSPCATVMDCKCHTDKGENFAGMKIVTDRQMKPGEWELKNGVITSNPPTTPEWEERFDDEFPTLDIKTLSDFLPAVGIIQKYPERIKDFIRYELEQARGKAYMDGFSDGETAGVTRGRADVLAELEEKLPPIEPEEFGHYGPYDHLHIQSNMGFNSYRTAVLQLIHSLKEK